MENTSVQQSLPIRWGGQRVLFAFCIPPIVWYILGRTFPSISAAPLFGLTVLVAAAHIHALIAFKNPITWWRNYRRRNIQGYWLWCYRDPDGSIVKAVLPRDENYIGEMRTTILTGRSVSLGIPLGGWFNRSVGIYVGPRIEHALLGWQAKLADVYPDGGIDVQLADTCRGECLVLNTDAAIAFLEHLATHNGDGSLGGVVRTLLVEVDSLQSSLTAAKTSVAELGRDLQSGKIDQNAALDAAFEVIEALDGVNGTLKPNKTRRLRNRLAERLMSCLPNDDPRRAQLAPIKGGSTEPNTP